MKNSNNTVAKQATSKQVKQVATLEPKKQTAFQVFHEEYKSAKEFNSSLGGCLAFLLNNPKFVQSREAFLTAQTEYKLFADSGLPKMHKTSLKYNAWQVGQACLKYAAKK